MSVEYWKTRALIWEKRYYILLSVRRKEDPK